MNSEGTVSSAGAPWVPLATCALWSLLLTVSLAGGFQVAPDAKAEVTPPPPPPVEKIEIPLTPEEPPPPPSATPPPPSAALVPAPPPIEPPPPAAAPVPPDAFTLPALPKLPKSVEVQALVRPALIAAETAPVPAPPTPRLAETPVRVLAYSGEGKQPAPLYPREALRRGQEGTVEIVVDIGREGRITTAEIFSPSPWPLLNQAALRAVRERWHFPPGEVRRYLVPIRFKIEKK